MKHDIEGAALPPTGAVPRLLAKLFFAEAVATGNVEIAPGLHIITIAGDGLRLARWMVGDKIQIRIGSGLQTRTYTPMDWDTATGTTRILAHRFTDGPGSRWVQSIAPGFPVSLFGPRRSLNVSAFDASETVVVGDETAIGLAASSEANRFVMEARDAGVASAALDALKIGGAVVQRQTGDEHLTSLSEEMLQGLTSETTFVLAGRAKTIQHLIGVLRRRDIHSRRIAVKAYWADGKAGLD